MNAPVGLGPETMRRLSEPPPEAAQDFDEIHFSAEPVRSGSGLRAETRVLATDEVSRRRFVRYWRLIRRNGSGARRRYQPSSPAADSARTSRHRSRSLGISAWMNW